MSSQKTSGAHHHRHLESVSFSAFNNFITEQIRAAEIGRLTRTQKISYSFFQVSFQEITLTNSVC